MEKFEDYLKEARNDFCAKINEQDWNTELRIASESFLIAYDQVVDKHLEKNIKYSWDEVLEALTATLPGGLSYPKWEDDFTKDFEEYLKA